MIIKCVCTNKFQDDRYGRGNRVMNRKSKATVGQRQSYRCTVCTREHDYGGIVRGKNKKDDRVAEAKEKAGKKVKLEKKGRVR